MDGLRYTERYGVTYQHIIPEIETIETEYITFNLSQIYHTNMSYSISNNCIHLYVLPICFYAVLVTDIKSGTEQILARTLSD
jgi:hypothetical protein